MLMSKLSKYDINCVLILGYDNGSACSQFYLLIWCIHSGSINMSNVILQYAYAV